MSDPSRVADAEQLVTRAREMAPLVRKARFSNDQVSLTGLEADDLAAALTDLADALDAQQAEIDTLREDRDLLRRVLCKGYKANTYLWVLNLEGLTFAEHDAIRALASAETDTTGKERDAP